MLGPSAFSDHENGLDDGTVVDGVMRTVGVLPGFWSVDGYEQMIDTTRRMLQASDAEVFAFPYDWRQSNRVSARRLQRHVAPLIRARRETHPNARRSSSGTPWGVS